MPKEQWMLHMCFLLAMSSKSTVGQADILTFAKDLSESAAVAYSTIVNAYQYKYDGNSTYIKDGGNDMFDTGNQIYVRANGGSFQPVTYNSTTDDATKSFVGTSIAGHPFLFLVSPIQSDTLEIKEESNLGADGVGEFITFRGVIEVQPYAVQYEVYQVYATIDATVVQIFFTISSYMDYKSNRSWSFNLNITSTAIYNSLNIAQLKGNLSDVYLGYILLSKHPNGPITSQLEIEMFMKCILNQISGPPPHHLCQVSPDDQSHLEVLNASVLSEYAGQAYKSLNYSYLYEYDGDSIYIEDGGNDMYDTGNVLYVRANGGSFEHVFYNTTLSDSSGAFEGESIAKHPFLLLLAVKQSGTVEIKEESYLGANGNGLHSSFSGQVQLYHFTIQYETFQVFAAMDPTVVQIFFVLSSPTKFNSRGSWEFGLSVRITDTRTTENIALLSGNMSNIYLGYILLSKHPHAFETTQQEVENFLRNVLGQLADDESVHSSSDSVATTDASVATTGTSVATTGASVAAAGAFDAATSASVATTSDSVATTATFVTTNGTSVATTGTSVATTGDSVATTATFVTTNGTSVATTGTSVATTGDSVTTTGASVATTSDSVATTTSLPSSPVDYAKVDRVVSSLPEFFRSAYKSLCNSYLYDYDGGNTYIEDGGNDMYDIGNKLYVRENAERYQPIIYNRTISESGAFVGTSIATHPFLLLLSVNHSGTVEIKERSDLGADGSGQFNTFSGQVRVGDFAIQYEAFQVYAARDPTIVQVFFVLSSFSQFGSSESWTFALNVTQPWRKTTLNVAKLSGNMSNVLFGYTLLSKYPDAMATSQDEVDSFLENVLHQAAGNVSISLPPCPSQASRTEEPLTESPLEPSETQLFASSISESARSAYKMLNNSYIYEYDGERTYIEDGKYDMYDRGNKLYVRANGGSYQSVVYNSTIRDSSGAFEGASIAAHPFLLLLSFNKPSTVELMEESNFGADGQGQNVTFSGQVQLHHFTIHYKTFQVYAARDPTVVQIFFVLSNATDLGSCGLWTFELNIGISDNRLSKNTALLFGNICNVFLGYTLLSKYPGAPETSQPEVEAFLRSTFAEAAGKALLPISPCSTIATTTKPTDEPAAATSPPRPTTVSDPTTSITSPPRPTTASDTTSTITSPPRPTTASDTTMSITKSTTPTMSISTTSRDPTDTPSACSTNPPTSDASLAYKENLQEWKEAIEEWEKVFNHWNEKNCFQG